MQTNGSLDTSGVLEDCSGDQIDEDDGSGRGSNFKIVRTLDPGTYYIRVSTGKGTGRYSAFGKGTGRYMLNVRHNTRHAGNDSRDDPEPSTVSLAVNHSISRACAIIPALEQEAALEALARALHENGGANRTEDR